MQQKTALKPLFDRLIVQRVTKEEKTDTGLFIPESAQTPKNEGLVIAIGHKVEVVKVGDRVIFNQFAGLGFSVGGEEYISLKEVEVFGVFYTVDVDCNPPLEPEETHR